MRGVPDVSTMMDFEQKASQGEAFTRTDAERLLASADPIGLGRLGETARRRLSGDVITFGRVTMIEGLALPASRGEAGEVRLSGPVSAVEPVEGFVTSARTLAGDVPLTGFSAADIAGACDRDPARIEDFGARLRRAGLEAVAECPIDRFESLHDAVAAVEALTRAGLAVWRVTVDRAPAARRVDLALAAAELQARTGVVRAFAPLPRHEAPDAPSTGYDDVRTVAVARLICVNIPSIQVDWPLYGPKLAQVALLYGANDIDGVAAVDEIGLGSRRSPLEDIRRQIRAAAALPVERNGRYERLP